MPRLIVNADDFGLTGGINRAIIELNQAGVLTSTTLMAQAAATEEAIQLALANPSLGVGCHIVLVDGSPVLPPSALPNLASGPGTAFRTSLGTFFRDVMSPTSSTSIRLALAAEIEAEVTAQIRLLQSRGLNLTHVDTHKHTHMFPAVLRPVLHAARACGITRIRNPFDSTWSRKTAASVPLLRRAQVAALSTIETHVLNIISEQGFTTADGTIGVTITGSLNAENLRSTLANLPEGTWELVTHPGYHDAVLDSIHTRLKGSREIERNALLTLNAFQNIDLINFAQLKSRGTEAAIDS